MLSLNCYSDSKHAFAMLNAIHSRFKLVKKCCDFFYADINFYLSKGNK